MKILLLYLILVLCSYFFLGCESKGNINLISTENTSSQNIFEDTSSTNKYCWLKQYETKNMLVNRIPLPEGFERTTIERATFSDWLRHLPLKTGTPAVKLYNGALKYNQSAQFAVLDINVGKEDLQQCADAVMRLKAEYHFSKKENDRIHFNYTSGDNAEYSKWIEGYRPVVKNNKVSFVKSAPRDSSYKNFTAYLRQVFMYAGTSSLSKELQTVPLSTMQVGDVFIYGGFPGHAVIVLDMATHKKTGKRIFILAQSYMPAQDIHVLKNPNAANTPWYPLEFEGALETPEWTFQHTDLKRFK